MNGVKVKDIQPIEGFKVMEWLRGVREKYHELYMKDPEEYYRRIKAAGKRMQARIKSKSSKAYSYMLYPLDFYRYHTSPLGMHFN